MNIKAESGNNRIEDLRRRISPIHIAMFTTFNGQSIHSRPMLTMEMDENGELWFFTSIHSVKIDDIKKNAIVNVSYTDQGEQIFVSITGIARIIYDKDRIEELWKPVFNTWFENGKNDSYLILLNIRINHAEYWDASAYKMRNIINLFGAIITGESMLITSEHNSIELN